MIGSILGNRYKILRELGSGGMAKVYLAEDVKTNALVAAKLLYPQFGEDLSFIQRFNREAKLASTLTDPHIVRVLDYGADRDLHYLIMEYVEGKDLNEKLKSSGSFEWRQALEVVDQLATALEHAHQHGVVHRDIKPQNMMLDDTGMLKVLDFGIARVPTLPSLTQSGFIGSPYYASPEQAMGEEVDIRSDIYSSGIVLYELLSGNIPFDAKSPWSIISQHITSEPPPIDLKGGEVPENVRDLLDCMLAKRPEERFQSPTTLRQAISAVLAGQPVPPKDEAAPEVTDTGKMSIAASLKERASQAIEAEEWVRAADLLGQAARVTPHDHDLRESLIRAEAESRLVTLYRSATQAMEHRHWEEAISHFNLIVELRSDYKDTAQLLDKAHQSLKKVNRNQFVATRYQEGVVHLENQRWDEAVFAFVDVQKVMPGYEHVEELLAEAQMHSSVRVTSQFSKINIEPEASANIFSSQMWRWGLLGAGVLLIIVMSFMLVGNLNRAAGDNVAKDRLKILYEEAQADLAAGNHDQAVVKLEAILSENPDYADVAQLRRELVATSTPEPVIVVVAPTPSINPLAEKLAEAEDKVNASLWSDVIDILSELRKVDAQYEKVRVSSLFCDAYVARGLETVNTIDDNSLGNMLQAKQDFDAGVTECPRRIDLQDQAKRAAAALTAFETPPDDFDTLISLLNPIVAAAPGYANGRAKQSLYNAYLGRAEARQGSPETIAAALGDYEAALALNVDDPSQAQLRRAELLLSFTKQPLQPAATTAPVEVTSSPAPLDRVTIAAPTRTAVVEGKPVTTPSVKIKYSKPQLIGPTDDSIFGGSFAEVYLEWEAVGKLAGDEYYDLTIMHLFADEPQYTGSIRTQDTRVKISADIGVGSAGGDRFYWWVTVRKDNTASGPDKLDMPLSPRSDSRTFVWSP